MWGLIYNLEELFPEQKKILDYDTNGRSYGEKNVYWLITIIIKGVGIE